jgi:hypothetical protein
MSDEIKKKARLPGKKVMGLFCFDTLFIKQITNIWPYAVQIIKVESQNYYEQYHLKKHEQLKKEEKRE